MVATLSRRIAQDCVRSHPLQLRELPYASPRVQTAMLWHRRLDHYPAHRWLRASSCRRPSGRIPLRSLRSSGIIKLFFPLRANYSAADNRCGWGQGGRGGGPLRLLAAMPARTRGSGNFALLPFHFAPAHPMLGVRSLGPLPLERGFLTTERRGIARIGARRSGASLPAFSVVS